MRSVLFKSAIFSLTGVALLAASAAQAGPALPAINLTFDQFMAGGTPVKAGFSDAKPVGWTGGTGLIAIDAPNTAEQFTNGQYGVYGPFPNPPPGGNFIQADGNPTFATSFQQTITGLSVGTTYTLSFWQAAGQQSGFTGDTTEQWKVFFGAGSYSIDCSGDPCVVTSTDDEWDSPVMSTPGGGIHGWELVSHDFTATATSEVLRFLAWGDGGSTINEPPTVFLAGVNSPALSAPEPMTLSIFGAGMAGVWLRRRAKRKA